MENQVFKRKPPIPKGLRVKALPRPDIPWEDVYTGIKSSNRENLIKGLSAIAKYPFTIEMPCGHIMNVASENAIPKKSRRCPCRRPNHYFILYTDKE